MHLFKLYISSILLFLSLFSFSQNDRTIIDSLFKELETANDKSKIDILNNLSKNYWKFSIDSSLYFANEALNLAHIAQSQKGISDAYNRIGNVYSQKKENKLALEYYNKCLDIRIELGDSKGISDIYNNFAVVYSSENQHGLALEYFYKALQESKTRNDKEDISVFYSAIGVSYAELGDYKNSIKNFLLSLEIAQKINQENEIAKIYNNLGNIYHEISSYEEALKYFLDALEIYKKTDNQTGLSVIYNNLGIVYQSIKENDRALEYYQKALEIDLKKDQKFGQADSYNNIGTVYDEKGDKEKALEYYTKSLQLNKELDYSSGLATALNNIGLVYLDLGEFDKAYANLKESTDLSKGLNDNYSLANNYNNLAKLFVIQKQYSKAQYYLNQSIELSKKIKVKEWLTESYDLYYQLYSEQNNYKKALEYYKLYSEMNDTIFKATSTNRVTEMKIKFETGNLETENELLKKDNEIHLLELNRQRNIKNYWIAFSILILALAILSFRQFQLKKNTNNLLKSKNNQLRETNEKLTISENNLKELNATKDKFFSIIAHDLKNPFQSLLGFSEALYNQTEELNKEEINEYSQIIYESSQNLFNLLGNLLEWSKSQLGSMNLLPKKINLFESVDEVLELIELIAQKKNIKIVSLISKEDIAYADKHMISSVIRNLISNALKFTNHGGKIELSSITSENSITISVKDNGKGISEENLKKLFKIDQSYSTKGTENESGTGLGLILCKELITQSNGDISVKSTLGKGSDFQFTLPVSGK
ncbi:MAG: tetratricopeptide repeat protein [Bacteroidales bacterium]|jgi:signal transduction histidine kinase/tetratricopeptide (TPR) repeat protein|nr:tetratricopeptide repeat protein [Bacteroidales bacterium]